MLLELLLGMVGAVLVLAGIVFAVVKWGVKATLVGIVVYALGAIAFSALGGCQSDPPEPGSQTWLERKVWKDNFESYLRQCHAHYRQQERACGCKIRMPNFGKWESACLQGAQNYANRQR